MENILNDHFFNINNIINYTFNDQIAHVIKLATPPLVTKSRKHVTVPYYLVNTNDVNL